MAKILVASDIHVHNWMNYATLNQAGVPDRLLAYAKLAEDISKLVKKEKVEVVVIPGDLLHASMSEPMVLSIARGFLETIAKTGAAVIVTHGQHDLSSKSHSSSAIHSVITGITPDRDSLNIIYVPEPRVIEECGLKFYVHPWTENVEDIKYKDADVFLGHGIVDQAKNCEGYSFLGGFKPGRLAKRYRLSIIGDIHKGQTFEAKNGAITLIPGAPMQNSWRDDPNPGVWIVDYGKRIKLKFVSIYSLRDDGTYHRFLKVKESEYDESMSKPSVHYKIEYDKAGPNDEEETSESSVESMSLVEVAMEEVHKHKPEKPDIFREILNSAMKILPAKELRAPARVRTWKVTATNFLSIKFFEFLISEAGEILIAGKNGAGKTSLVEAFYYAWTGETTKPIPVGDINNWNIEGDMEVVIDFSIIKKKVERFWRIRRGRTEDGSSFCTLYKMDGETEQPFKKGSIKDTQNHIYNMIGLDKDDILLMCYYSTRKLKTFSNIGDTNKNSITGRLINFDQIYSLRDAINTVLGTYVSVADVLLGKIQEAGIQIDSRQSKLEEIESEEEKDGQEDEDPDLSRVHDLVDFVDGIEDLPPARLSKRLRKLESEYRKKADEVPTPDDVEDPLETKLRAYKVKLQKLSSAVDSLRSDTDEKEDQLKKSLKGECYACGQKLEDDGVVMSLYKKIEKLKQLEKGKQRRIGRLNNKCIELKNTLDEKKYASEKQFKKYKRVKDKLDRIRDAIDLLAELSKPTKKRDFTEAKKVINEDLEASRNSARVYKKKLVYVNRRKDAATLLKTKILNATGPVVRRYNELICTMIGAEINRLIINRKEVKARAVVGKSIDIEMKFRGGKWTPFASMSGGEERVGNILVMLAMNNLFSRKYKLKRGVLGVAIFDEVFSFLDPEYTDIAFAALQNCIADARVVITHDQRLQSYFDRTIQVRNTKGYSRYRLRQ